MNWSEGARGTNAIGTSLAERGLVGVWGYQHFCQAHSTLTCTAAPIVTPFGELAGVLDVSGDASLAPGYARGLVQMAVAQIEHRWFTLDLGGRRALSLHANPTLLGSWQEAILLFEDEVLMAANRVAITLLGLDWGSLGQLRFQHLFKGAMPGEITVPMKLRDGRELFARCTGVRQAPRAAAEPERRQPGPAGVYWDTAIRDQLKLAMRAVNADIPVLILGETGTGKEMFARALHASSRRSHKPLVVLNCAAIPEGLIESELFGYEDGAFTGARHRGSPGKIREADGGILFLDEIGDMPLSMQARLLRVLQNREVTPLGGKGSVVVDFVPVCATNRDLEAEVRAGRVRADLFYRLQHFCVHLPPLRERPEFSSLLDTVLRGSGADERRIRFSPEACQALHQYRWPGNFRELANLLRTLVALADDGACIQLADLPPEIRQSRPLPDQPCPAHPSGPGEPRAMDSTDQNDAQEPLRVITRHAVDQAIAAHGGNMSAAARSLGLHRSTLYRMLQR
jgi:transcriptional regulator of acetoin/glycerol metabolism